MGLLRSVATMPRALVVGERCLIRIGKISDDLISHAVDLGNGDQSRLNGIRPNDPHDEAYKHSYLDAEESNQQPTQDIK
ncbi:hypothetical protein ACQZ5G_08070 [Agrobacterium sp. 22-214-1]